MFIVNVSIIYDCVTKYSQVIGLPLGFCPSQLCELPGSWGAALAWVLSPGRMHPAGHMGLSSSQVTSLTCLGP